MEKDKEYVFWFHYNKHESREQKRPQITVHFKNKCHIVDNVVINVPTHGHIRNDQPYFVIKGKVLESQFSIKEGIAYIG